MRVQEKRVRIRPILTHVRVHDAFHITSDAEDALRNTLLTAATRECRAYLRMRHSAMMLCTPDTIVPPVPTLDRAASTLQAFAVLVA